MIKFPSKSRFRLKDYAPHEKKSRANHFSNQGCGVGAPVIVDGWSLKFGFRLHSPDSSTGKRFSQHLTVGQHTPVLLFLYKHQWCF